MKKKQKISSKNTSSHSEKFLQIVFSYFFKKVLQFAAANKHIKPCMLSVALAFASIALNIGHARFRQYMFATRLFYVYFFNYYSINVS